MYDKSSLLVTPKICLLILERCRILAAMEYANLPPFLMSGVKDSHLTGPLHCCSSKGFGHWLSLLGAVDSRPSGRWKSKWHPLLVHSSQMDRSMLLLNG